MTNKMIILTESIELMNQGKLKGTGEYIEIEENGEVKKLEIPEPIHTFNGWKQRGFIVKKGEKSEIKFPIWKHTTRKKEDKNGEEKIDERMFMKMSAFFTADQVEVIAK